MIDIDGWMDGLVGSCYLLDTLGQFVFSLLPSAQEKKYAVSVYYLLAPFFFFFFSLSYIMQMLPYICSQPAASSFSPRSLDANPSANKRLAGLEGEWLSCVIGPD